LETRSVIVSAEVLADSTGDVGKVVFEHAPQRGHGVASQNLGGGADVGELLPTPSRQGILTE
jgi:hypothetical protein